MAQHCSQNRTRTHRRRTLLCGLCFGFVLLLVLCGIVTLYRMRQREAQTSHQAGLALRQQVQQAQNDLYARAQSRYGCWYGYLQIDTGTGIYRYLPGERYDAYLYLTASENDPLRGTLRLYLQRDAAPFAAAVFDCDGECITCTQGSVLQQDMHTAAWQLTRDATDGAYRVQDGFQDAQGNGFTYHLVLQPWGETWLPGDAQLLPPGYEAYSAAIAQGAAAPAEGGS